MDTEPLRGPVIDVFGSASLAWSQINTTIGGASPGSLRFQGWPETQAAHVAEARRRWPGVQVSLCPGVDPVAKRWRSHRAAAKAVRELVEIADRTVDLDISALVFDPEAAWKGSIPDTQAELAEIASDAIAAITEKHPELRLYATTYGWPVRTEGVGGHGDFAWRGWFPGNVTYVSQVYDRGYGKLLEGEAIAAKSFTAAKASGWVSGITPRLPEVQTHHNQASELVQLAAAADVCFFWAAGSDALFDLEGARGWRAALALWRLGRWHDVAGYQRDRGLVADGIVGPKTLAALGRETL